MESRVVSIRVRLSSERAGVASRLTRLLADAGNIELLSATDDPADVLVLDCAALDAETLRSCRQTARRNLPARVLWLLDAAPAGMHATRIVLDAVKAGWCSGYVLVDSQLDTLARAISAVARHDIFLPRAMLVQALSGSRYPPAAMRPAAAALHRGQRARVLLTIRERQVLQQVLRGLPSKEVGRILGIREDTVKKHLRNVYAKLGVRGRTQLLLGQANRARTID